jgi:hypothetical protein
MNSNNTLAKYKKDLDRLIVRGNHLLVKLVFEESPSQKESYKNKDPKGYKLVNDEIDQFRNHYQQWYSEAYDLVRQLLPSRLSDFEGYYKAKPNRKEITYENYTVEDALQGLQVTRGWEKEKIVGADAAIPRLQQQLKIVESVNRRFDSTLFDIKNLVQAELLDNELESAGELLKSGYFRAAGVVIGVVLEAHLANVMTQRSLKHAKKSPTLADYNDALKDAGVIDIAEWRRIQHLTDLRNKCGHKRAQDPTKEDIEDLLAGASRVIKNIF